MKVFVDTNIILDWMLDNRPFKDESETILTAAKKGTYKLVVTTQSIIDAQFTTRKNGIKYKEFIEYIEELRTYAEIIGIDQIDMLWAMSHHSGDFEDDMQYASAYNAVCDYFITRNKELLKLNDPYCPMTVITPDDFVGAMMAD